MQRYIFFIRLYAKKEKYYTTNTNFFKKMLTTAVASILLTSYFSPLTSYFKRTFLPFTMYSPFLGLATR